MISLSPPGLSPEMLRHLGAQRTGRRGRVRGHLLASGPRFPLGAGTFSGIREVASRMPDADTWNRTASSNSRSTALACGPGQPIPRRPPAGVVRPWRRHQRLPRVLPRSRPSRQVTGPRQLRGPRGRRHRAAGTGPRWPAAGARPMGRRPEGRGGKRSALRTRTHRGHGGGQLGS